MNFKFNKGITLLEIMIIIVVISIIIAIVTPNFSSFKNHQKMTNTTEDIVSLLNEARNNTISSKDSKNYGVHFSENQIVLFSGSTYSSSASDNKVVTFDSVVHIVIPSGIILANNTSGNNNIIFERIMGNTNQSGTITLTLVSDSNVQKVISINKTGFTHEN